MIATLIAIACSLLVLPLLGIILGDTVNEKFSGLGETALNTGNRVIIVSLVLVAGTANQTGLPSNALPTGYARTVSGGTLGHITCSMSGTTLTVTSSSATETSTVTVFLNA